MEINTMNLPKSLHRNKLAKSIVLASIMVAGSANAGMIDLTNTSGSYNDQTAPVLSANSALLSASSWVSYTVNSLTSFDWFFQATDALPYNDYSFFNIGAGNVTLASVASVGSSGNSGLQTLNLGTAYTGSITFGVYNDIDSIADSTLTISNVATAVPEPSSLALLGLGIAGLAFTRKRKQAS